MCDGNFMIGFILLFKTKSNPIAHWACIPQPPYFRDLLL